tara:strand:+ start:151080 stop:153290 length:2211 start_codon:yes stop_codon:yes gene_type:complete
MDEGKNILLKFKKRWQVFLWLKIFIYAFGIAIFFGFIFSNLILAVPVFLFTILIGSLVLKPWGLSLAFISWFADSKIRDLEYSSGLLLQEENLSGLAKLQQQKIANRLSLNQAELKPEVNILKPTLISIILIIIGVVVFQFGILDLDSTNDNQSSDQETISFVPVDPLVGKTVPPSLTDQKLTLTYPSYTNIPSRTTSVMEIKALKGSTVSWELGFDSKLSSVSMESMGTSYSMKLKGDKYSRGNSLNVSGFYNFKFTDTSGNEYASKLYSIEVFEDRSPEIEIKTIPKFLTFEMEDDKRFSFNTVITDDFGIGAAYIIATVSKGSGESVKFREEKLLFKESVKRGEKYLEFSKSIDLDQFKMEAGDELYFYVEALDLKQPISGKARSETYFAVIKDTTNNQFEVEGTMGEDLMPDYFRSQRQLIIDTEKLISERKKISKTQFNTTSNELGFDQKALRLKYGQFMGDEADSGLDLHNQDTDDAQVEDKDPLAEYTHDHDGENDHNLVDKKESAKLDETSKNPLSKFTHDHDNAEESTLFTDSLKSKLRQALDLMWDAELQLRMYAPEKSLPYQYKILQLLQDIKNSARIYVHRIGFDPPPIKNEVRLTGKIDEVGNFEKLENLGDSENDVFIKKAIARLEGIIGQSSKITESDKLIFEKAGNELVLIAIENPGMYLKTLQELKTLTQNIKLSIKDLLKIQNGLIKALRKVKPKPTKVEKYSSELDSLLLKEMETNE